MEKAYPSPVGKAAPAPAKFGWLRNRLPSREATRAMAAFTARRLAFGVIVLLAIIYLTYFGFGLLDGAPFFQALVNAAGESGAYLVHLSQGDFGLSRSGSQAFRAQPVGEILPQVVGRSFGLLGVTFLLAVVAGTTLGAWAAQKRHSRLSILLILTSILGISTPSFFAALFLQLAAIQYTRTFGQSILPVGGFGWDKHLVLPVLVLAARPVAQIARISFVSISEVFDQDYVRTAHSKGLHASMVFWVHVLRNAAVPILTTFAVSLRFALSTLPVVEVYFGWGGIGETLLRSLFNGDTNLTIALFLTLGVLFILVNLLLEISYMLIDPRLRESENEARRNGSFSLGESWRDLLAEFRFLLFDNPLATWLRERFFPKANQASPFPMSREEQEQTSLDEAPPGDNSRWRAWRRGMLGNLPLLLGGVIVALLVFLTIYGPHLSPYSPNTTQLIQIKNGEISVPPFPPSPDHPWGTDPRGRDMLSLVVSGAQQTMIPAVSVVALRMLLGFVLGVLAGWFSDSWFDRAIMALNQAIAVYPTLLLAALLIFIIGFQGGMRTFLLALALVGWGEIMQFVRGEVMSIRTRPFMESAVAVGQRSSRMVLMHVLPNLAPALVSVAALEAGAVLLLLGELGFLGIFIQGGASTDYGLYSRVPEWGGLLSNVRTWTRSYPWTGFFPSAAFFVAVLGFTLLGEGVRQLVGQVGVVINRFANRYTFALTGLLVAAFFWARGNTGELVFYRQQAETFRAENAMEHIKALTAPEMQGRALGTDGAQKAAAYIAGQFDRLGLQVAGEGMSFFQGQERTYLALTSPPVLEVQGKELAPTYLQDYALFPRATANTGEGQGALRVLAFGPKADAAGLDLAGQVPLLLTADDLPKLAQAQCAAVLIATSDLSEIKRNYTYSPLPAGTGCGQDTPVLLVSEQFASRLIRGSGSGITNLRDQAGQLLSRDRLDIPVETSVRVAVQGEARQVPAVNVIGQMPGLSDQLDNQLYIVAAQYDAPPLGIQYSEGGAAGISYPPGANDNASGVGVMLEAIRTMQESGYEPERTFLFVAYSGEGLPDLRAAPEVERYLEARSTFAGNYEIQGVIYLRGLGAGDEQNLAIQTLGRSAISKRLEAAINLAGLKTQRIQGEAPMYNFPPVQYQPIPEAPAYPQVGISRMGWERGARLSNDSTTFMTTPELGKAGRAIALALMVLGR